MLAAQADSFIDYIKLDDQIPLWISDNPQRIFALINPFDLLFQKFTEDNDAFVAHPKMFQRAVGDRSLGFPRHGVLSQHVIQAILTALVS